MIQARPVILCGGSGARLWPLSRAGFPKQFLCLAGKDSLFQASVRRLSGLSFLSGVDLAPALVVTNEEHRFLALEQLREMGVELGSILLEPTGRNTAPALTLAALAAVEGGADPVLVVTPADHNVTDHVAFQEAISAAIDEAAEGHIVVLGVEPTSPATGYGYIQACEADSAGMVVQRFVEKPDMEKAKSYIASGNFYWNAGVFVLKASVWLRAIEHFRMDISASIREAWSKRVGDSVFVRPCKRGFEAVPSDSIDCAVIELCPDSAFSIKMLPLQAGWCDLGAWDSVWDVAAKDQDGNVANGDVLMVDTSGAFVHSNSRLVAVVGVRDVVVIETADAVLVTQRSRSQDVRRVVELLDLNRREELNLHRKVHRPWGWYDSVDEGGQFRVKRIQVNPKASLSLQKHFHRAEHWVVVKGVAEITRGSETLLLGENQSTYIPLGEVHRLANVGDVPLEIIEVQSGSYLGEDDIVRFDDEYGRS